MGLRVLKPAGASAAWRWPELVLGAVPLDGPRSVAAAGERRPPQLSGSPPTVAELLELMREEPSRGAPLFYDRFQRDVNRLVWRLLGADPEHDDLVQQVFLIAFRRIDQVRDAEKLLGWVRSIAVSVVYDEIRKRRVRRLFLRDAVENEVHPSLVHDVEVRDFVLRAKRILDRMPAAERVVFLLHVLEGKGMLEIAELCGHSIATAKRRMSRANGRFAKLVARDPDLARLLGGARATGGSPGELDDGGDA
jgi:RNA polymerase sigma-70 factor (ECF subfamily)